MKVDKFGLEAQLLKWSGSTSSSGPIVVMLLASDEDLEPFKTMALAKKGAAGQRLAVAVAVIGDDEKLVEHEVPEKQPKSKAHFPGGFCGLAVQWGQDERFQRWLAHEHPILWDRAGNQIDSRKVTDVTRVEWVIKEKCGIVSRNELDSDKVAHDRFDEIFRQPYMKAVQADPLSQRPPFVA